MKELELMMQDFGFSTKYSYKLQDKNFEQATTYKATLTAKYNVVDDEADVTPTPTATIRPTPSEIPEESPAPDETDPPEINPRAAQDRRRRRQGHGHCLLRAFRPVRRGICADPAAQQGKITVRFNKKPAGPCAPAGFFTGAFAKRRRLFLRKHPIKRAHPNGWDP